MCSILTILKTICYVLVPGAAGGSWGVTQPLIIPLLSFSSLLPSHFLFSSLPVPSVLFSSPTPMIQNSSIADAKHRDKGWWWRIKSNRITVRKEKKDGKGSILSTDTSFGDMFSVAEVTITHCQIILPLIWGIVIALVMMLEHSAVSLLLNRSSRSWLSVIFSHHTELYRRY